MRGAVQALTQLGMLPWLNGMCAANDEVDRLYASRTDERSEREASKGITAPCGWLRPIGKQPSRAKARPSDTTASLRKTYPP